MDWVRTQLKNAREAEERNAATMEQEQLAAAESAAAEIQASWRGKSARVRSAIGRP
jgi:hypothetical protein